MENDEYKIMYEIERSYWWFLGKQFLVKNILKTLTSVGARQGKILDIGCGSGIILKALEKFGTAYGIELSFKAIHFLKKRNLSRIVQSDINQSISYKKNTFSVITCLDVLEHVEDDLALLNEVVRVCKPGGHIIITVPAFNALWSSHDIALHHKRRYTRKSILEKISAMRCSVVKSSYFNVGLFLPIFAVRKIKPIFSRDAHIQSDFFVKLPEWLNRTLIFLYTIELNMLQFLSFPFGLSVLLILQKEE